MTRLLSFILLLASFGLNLGATSSDALVVTSTVIEVLIFTEFIFHHAGTLTTWTTVGTKYIPASTTGQSSTTTTTTLSTEPGASSSVTIITPTGTSLSSPTASGSRNSAGLLSAPNTISSTSPAPTSFSLPPGLYLTSYSTGLTTINSSPVVLVKKFYLTNTC